MRETRLSFVWPSFGSWLVDTPTSKFTVRGKDVEMSYCAFLRDAEWHIIATFIYPSNGEIHEGPWQGFSEAHRSSSGQHVHFTHLSRSCKRRHGSHSQLPLFLDDTLSLVDTGNSFWRKICTISNAQRGFLSSCCGKGLSQIILQVTTSRFKWQHNWLFLAICFHDKSVSSFKWQQTKQAYRTKTDKKGRQGISHPRRRKLLRL